VYNSRQFPGLINLLFPPAQTGQQWGGGLGSLIGLPQGWGAPGTAPPGPPPGFPPAAGGTGGPPPGPPPAVPPVQQTGYWPGEGVGTFAVDPGSMNRCLYRYTYVTLENRRRFWFWPVYIGRTSVAGYRWRPRQQRWVYMGLDTRQILSFQCY
jgi:hypothetical protein